MCNELFASCTHGDHAISCLTRFILPFILFHQQNVRMGYIVNCLHHNRPCNFHGVSFISFSAIHGMCLVCLLSHMDTLIILVLIKRFNDRKLRRNIFEISKQMKNRIHKVIILMFDVLDPGSSKCCNKVLMKRFLKKWTDFFIQGLAIPIAM